MICRYCSHELGETAEYCSRCGQPTGGEAMAAAIPAGAMAFGASESGAFTGSRTARRRPPVEHSAPKADPRMAATTEARPDTASEDRVRRRWLSRHRPSTYVLWVMLLAILSILFYAFYTVSLGKPADLGVRYTEGDYQLALAKTGMSYQFLNMNEEEAKAFVKAHRNDKLMLADYEINYTGYVARTFELTPREATAFLNEFLPMFSVFKDVQLSVPENGRLEASFGVHMQKLREELLPDLIGTTEPEFLGRLIPRYLNVHIDGPAFVVQNSRLIQREQLDVLKVGAISLRPFIGNTDRDLRDLYASFAERLYKGAPRLRIQTLRINERRNFEFSGTLPLRITIRKLQ